MTGWKKVTDAVHQAGGLIFAQLWHGKRSPPPSLLLIPRIEFVSLVGRVAHPDAREQKESGRVSRVLPG